MYGRTTTQNYWGGGGEFGTAKCGTAKLYHILRWYLRTEATFLPLPDLCTFSLHSKVPRLWIVGDIMFSISTLFHRRVAGKADS